MNQEARREVPIRTPDQRLRVFVSSTMVELAEERRAALRAISALRLTPVVFELGARPHSPRELYRAYLAQSDVFIGLYWQQYGQIGPAMKVSALEEEFDLSRNLPRLMYVKAPAPDRDPRLTELLSRVRQEASYRRFATAAELDQLVRDDLATLLSERFAPAHRTLAQASSSPRVRRPLPVSATSLIGREDAIEELARLVGQPDARLVTLTGPGGVGKTRLAVAVGEKLLNRFGPYTAFVSLSTATRREQVLAGVGQAVQADLGGTASALEALVERLGDTPWLLILDNLEQVFDCAPDLDALLTRCTGVAILATSRRVLLLRAEREYPVPHLPLPEIPASMKIDGLAASPAVALFVDRAVTVRRDFVLTKENAEAVVAICRRLEGLPLAIELAAARTRLLEPNAILRRLETSLDALGGGTVDMPERQQTLRATVEWSVGMLDEAERSMLETMAVFAGGWTLEAVALVAGLDENRSLELNEALARQSLVHVDNTPLGPRSRMLETIREFVAERLAKREDVADIERRHADCYRTLVEQSDQRLRGVGHDLAYESLRAESGNLAAAVEWYLAHDRRPLPHLFRVLWPFWEIRDYMREAHGWVQRLMSAGDDFDLQGRAEMLWAAVVTANELGDDQAVLSARERLRQVLDGIRDPVLHALSLLVMGWTSPIVGDFEGARQEASGALNELRGLDEPYWSAVALATTGFLETAVGHDEVALTQFREAQEVAERLGNTWLSAISVWSQGTLAVRASRLDDARQLLEEALDLAESSTYSTRAVALCLIGFARLAVKTGAAETAALLVGAAEGLRNRVGLRVWPPLRGGEAELSAQLRQALGARRFEQICADGAGLNHREAVAVARREQVEGRPAH